MAKAAIDEFSLQSVSPLRIRWTALICLAAYAKAGLVDLNRMRSGHHGICTAPATLQYANLQQGRNVI